MGGVIEEGGAVRLVSDKLLTHKLSQRVTLFVVPSSSGNVHLNTVLSLPEKLTVVWLTRGKILKQHALSTLKHINRITKEVKSYKYDPRDWAANNEWI